jgi:hypothetical protein
MKWMTLVVLLHPAGHLRRTQVAEEASLVAPLQLDLLVPVVALAGLLAPVDLLRLAPSTLAARDVSLSAAECPSATGCWTDLTA